MIDNKYGCIVNVLMHIVVLSAKWQRGKNYRFFFMFIGPCIILIVE